MVAEIISDRPAPKIDNKWSKNYRAFVERCLDKNRGTRAKIS